MVVRESRRVGNGRGVSGGRRIGSRGAIPVRADSGSHGLVRMVRARHPAGGHVRTLTLYTHFPRTSTHYAHLCSLHKQIQWVGFPDRSQPWCRSSQPCMLFHVSICVTGSEHFLYRHELHVLSAQDAGTGDSGTTIGRFRNHASADSEATITAMRCWTEAVDNFRLGVIETTKSGQRPVKGPSQGPPMVPAVIPAAKRGRQMQIPLSMRPAVPCPPAPFRPTPFRPTPSWRGCA